MMKNLRQRVYDEETVHDLEAGQQHLRMNDIRSALVEFGVAEATMLDAVCLAFEREGSGSGHMTFGELRAAVAGIKDPSSPFSKAGWRDKLSKSFAHVLGDSGSQNLGISRDQKVVYSAFLDRLMPVLEEQVNFLHPTADFVRRRKSGTGRRIAIPKSKSTEPGLFGGPAFKMPTIAESSSAPIMNLADLKDDLRSKKTDNRDSVDAILKGLPPPQKQISPTRAASRPGTHSSSASSCWSEFRERKSPFRAPRMSMDELLRADVAMIDQHDQWKTVAQLEINDPGSGLANEKEKLKMLEDRFFNKMENIQKARYNVEGRVHADLDRRDKRYENRLNHMADIRGAIQSKVDEHRDLSVGLGNIMIPSGDLENPPKFRGAQIFEGPAMDAKREQVCVCVCVCKCVFVCCVCVCEKASV